MWRAGCEVERGGSQRECEGWIWHVGRITGKGSAGEEGGGVGGGGRGGDG